MSVDVTVETIIRRPVDVVAGYAADPANAPSWYANIESVEWRTAPPLAIGTEVDFVARFLGKRLAYTYRFAEYVPGERLVMSTAQGPFPMETTYTWRSVPGGTRMSLRNRGEPAGLLRVAGSVAAAAVRRATTKDLARLKAVLEQG
ncbi:SRPBCC family protein [Tessaracoccus oleiagri]|uniref:Polyketide cyclase / dehydrase and lipid transport n=1 Tax=Tessaracoccus oleiagri TaxID=686624 RepID=A0A1G9L7S5_9ACTN|nr:SRPBCC family protein [Tessaracoccus oleiagri]SDL57992.1 Polyketide cyclase / dehydrase and lipid transport [Tessaracoccus oleiagri]